MFHLDPGWYETYWSIGLSRVRRPAFITAVGQVVLIAALLCGGVALFNHFHGKDPWQGYQQWERE
jgi:hypothetical protein